MRVRCFLWHIAPIVCCSLNSGTLLPAVGAPQVRAVVQEAVKWPATRVGQQGALLGRRPSGVQPCLPAADWTTLLWPAAVETRA